MRLRDELREELPRRSELLERVMDALRADERVVRTDLIGSLNGGKADEFSDIDVAAHLATGTVDRQFFFDVPALLTTVGPAVAGWGFTSLPDQYVATFHFDDWPLLWGVDVACVSDTHVDGSDLVSEYRWEQIYKMWVLAAKYVARGDAKLADVQRLVERHAEIDLKESNAADRLRGLLAGIESRKRERGDPYLLLHNRCLALAEALG